MGKNKRIFSKKTAKNKTYSAGNWKFKLPSNAQEGAQEKE